MGQETGDLTQQRQRELEGLPAYHRPKHQAKQTENRKMYNSSKELSKKSNRQLIQ